MTPVSASISQSCPEYVHKHLAFNAAPTMLIQKETHHEFLATEYGNQTICRIELKENTVY